MITGCNWEDCPEIYTNGNKALAFAKAIPEAVYPEKTNFHFCWRVPLEFGRKQVLALKSCVTTQNLENVNIIMWSNVDLSRNEWIQPIARHIELRIWDPVKEAEGTSLEGLRLLTKDDEHHWLGGDLFRLLVLYKYGGVYVDQDVVFIRDFAPLLDQEFMYQWGTETPTSPQNAKINGAVMRMFKQSKLATDLITTLPKMPAGFDSTDWSATLYGEVRKTNKNWTVFPCAFFNPEWQLFINMGESAHPFRNGSDSKLDFDGTFSWHWHNKWDAPIEEGSKFQRLEAKVNEKYEHEFNYVTDKNKRHLGGNLGGGDPGTFYPALWHWLVDTYKVKTLLDVGCAEAHSTQWFQTHGVEAIGIDGLEQNIDNGLARGVKDLFICDLTKDKFNFISPIDMIWCCEVVEHIEEIFIGNLFGTFNNVNANIVVMTFGQPGQAGWHHVNCQPKEYWIEKMNDNGFQFLETDTKISRELVPALSHYGKTGLIFRKKVS
jgi:hypothetical protein